MDPDVSGPHEPSHPSPIDRPSEETPMNESAELSAAAADARIIPSSRDTDESWRRCCRRLRAELGENVFTSWFGRPEARLDRGRPRAILGADALPQELDRGPLQRPHSRRARSRDRRRRVGRRSGCARRWARRSRRPPRRLAPSQPKAIDPARQAAARVASAVGVARRRHCARRPPCTASRSPVRRSIVG